MTKPNTTEKETKVAAVVETVVENVPAVKKETSVSQFDDYWYGDDAGAGFEGMSGDDYSIPFIQVVQSNSKVIDEGKAGAAAGLFFNTVTGEFNSKLIAIPVDKETLIVEWIPRDAGGGLVAVHEVESTIVKEAVSRNGGVKTGKGLKTLSGNDLVETHYVYVLLLEDDGITPAGFAVIPASSTKIKPVKNWFTAVRQVGRNIPLFASRAEITLVKQKNNKGQTFFNLVVNPLKVNADNANWKTSLLRLNDETHLATYESAKEFREMVISGKAKADYSKQEAQSPEDNESDSDKAF